MKPRTIILILALVAAVQLAESGERLGDLNRDSIVLTPDSDIDAPSVTTRDGHPVFEIIVPEGTSRCKSAPASRISSQDSF